MRRLVKYAYRTLLPEKIARSVDLFAYLRIPGEEGFREKRVLVLSPHPDDDVIGCGGALHRYHLSGADITSVYMTDGSKGNPRYGEDELVSVRKEEARRAAGVIGIDRLIFLDNRDSRLAPSSKNVSELSRILGDLKPEAVFLPFLTDNHPDHAATARVLHSSLKRDHASFMCYMYGVWTPLPVYNLTVDITPHIEIKKKAIERHKSQLETYDYAEASLSLSRYYSIVSGGKKKGWAEVYIACPSREYVRLCEVAGW